MMLNQLINQLSLRLIQSIDHMSREKINHLEMKVYDFKMTLPNRKQELWNQVLSLCCLLIEIEM